MTTQKGSSERFFSVNLFYCTLDIRKRSRTLKTMNLPEITKTTLVKAYQDRIASLQAYLAAPALDGTPFMIVATIEHRVVSGYRELELVYGSFDESARYDETAKPTFRSLEIIQDNLCGVSMFEPAKAQQLAEAIMRTPETFMKDGWTLKKVEARHMRDEPMRRLQRSKMALEYLLEQAPVATTA